MFSKFILASLLVVVAATVASAINDPCGMWTTCSSCITGHSGCGWCYENTSWPNPDGRGYIPGPKCAGRSGHTSGKFLCHAEYSTTNCGGWSCNQAVGVCIPNNNGEGYSTKGQCAHNCSVNTHQFICDNETHTCKQVPQGTAGSSSLLVCQQHCSITATATATGSPHSHHPSPPPTTTPLFACNYSSGQCVPSTPGHGESKEACEAMCKHETNVSYMCLTYPQPHCVKQNVPGGPTKAACEATCNPTMAPNPPPAMVGFFRGLSIGNAYKEGVYYLDVNETTATYVAMKLNKVVSWFIGTPEHTPPSPGHAHEQMNVKITSSSDSSQVGKVWNTIADTSGQNSPVASFITLAAGAVGSPAPATVKGGFASDLVLGLAKCLPGTHCQWEMPSLDAPHEPPQLLGNLRAAAVKSQQGGPAQNDPCSAAGAASCKTCLALPAADACGWCGASDVEYVLPDGQKVKGTHCASESSKTPFICSAAWNTLTCPVLYKCVTSSAGEKSCVKSGDKGVPLQTCEANCTTPITTAVPPKQYVCNVTEKKCFLCPNASCSGSMPQAPCEAACIHPKPGPGPHSLLGLWRCMRVSSNMENFEWDYDFNNKSVTTYEGGKKQSTADVIHLGGDSLIFTYTSGHLKGLKKSVYFQQANENPGYEAITMAFSQPNGPMPESVFPAMYTAGMEAFICYKCTSAPCKFRNTP